MKQLQFLFFLLISNLLGSQIHAQDSSSNEELTCHSLSKAFYYNVFIRENIRQSMSDTQGRMAAGGNVFLHHYTVGDKIPYSEIKKDNYSLIAAGDLKNTSHYMSPEGYGMLSIVRGQQYFGGQANIVNVLPPARLDKNLNKIVDFEDEFKKLIEFSSNLASLPSNTQAEYFVSSSQTTSNPQNDCLSIRCRVKIENFSDALVIVEMNSEVLSRISELTIQISDNATLIINVIGEELSLQNFAFFPQRTDKKPLRAAFNNRQVLWNMPEVTSLFLNRIGFEGSILAPLANVNYPGGVFYGTLIANSLNSYMLVEQGVVHVPSGQFNLELFEGCKNFKF